MANQIVQECQLDETIDQIIHQNLDPITKASQIQKARSASFSEKKKANSIQTILSISNTLVGTSTLLFPIQFREVGIGTSFIISIIIAIISTKTNVLIIKHNKTEELDLPQTILRVMGPKWKIIFNVSNIILLWASGMIYMSLICNQIYPVLCLVLDNLGVAYSKQSEIDFSMISYQWVGVFYFFLSLPLLLQKNLGFLLKLIPFGFLSVLSFFIFIIIRGCNNVYVNGTTLFDQITWFTTDISKIAGTFTLSLMIQSLIVPIAKNSDKPKLLKRDISIAYLWTWFLYMVVGVFGAFAIAGVKPRQETIGATVLDYFEVEWSIILIQVLLFFQLSLIFPVLQFIVRSQFFGLIYYLEEPPQLAFYGFTVFYSLTCLVVQAFEVKLDLMIGLTGALVGLFHIYIIPIGIHLKCFYENKSKVEVSNIQAQIQRQSNNRDTTENEEFMSNIDMNSFIPSDQIDMSCNDHTREKKRFSKNIRFISYSLVLFIGFYVAVSEVIQVIQK